MPAVTISVRVDDNGVPSFYGMYQISLQSELCLAPCQEGSARIWDRMAGYPNT